jgi:sortase A
MEVRRMKWINFLIAGGVIVLLVSVQANASFFAAWFGSLSATANVTLSPLPVESPTGLRATATVALPAPSTPTPTQRMPGLQPTASSSPPKATLPPPTPDLGDAEGARPTRIRIAAIHVDAPVVPIGWEMVNVDGLDGQGGQSQAMWQVPDWYAAGWHETSAKLGVPGNTVLNGHNTTNGEVFRDLYKLEPGTLIVMDDENGGVYKYRVQHVHILPEAGQPLEVRVQNARYIQSTEDERLTLVTCHPYGSLRNRLVVVALPEPVSEEEE